MASEQRMKALFANIARGYDTQNRVMSLGLDVSWRRRAAAALDDSIKNPIRVTANLIDLVRNGQEMERSARRGLEGRPVLDLASGTGDMALALMAAAGGKCAVTAADISPEMMRIAMAKTRKRGFTAIDAFSKNAQKDIAPAPGEILFRKASAMNLPFQRDAFDAAVCAFGLRNFPEMEKPLKELRRVVRPGGRLCVVEFFRPESFVKRALVNAWLAVTGFFAGPEVSQDYAHLRKSIGKIGHVSSLLRTAEKCHWQLLRLEKYFPACYMAVFR